MVQMSNKLTRRQAAIALSGSVALVAQTPSAPIPQNPDEELKAAKESLQHAQEQLDKFNLPMSTEPAVHFRA